MLLNEAKKLDKHGMMTQQIKISDKKIRAMPFPMLSFINCVTQKTIDKNARISLNNLLNICCYLSCKIKKNFY